jgi:CubicO group peptidase (beta-lactamase class C family)
MLGDAAMSTVTRRQFAADGFVLTIAVQALFAERLNPSRNRAIDDTLSRGIVKRKIPAVTAAVATRERIIYQGAFGKRDSVSGMEVKPDSIFAIASMTKAITSAAALQLVEQGRLTLTEPVSKYLPQLANIRVLDGYDDAGQPTFHSVRTPITLKHLLTHTSGFCYDRWSDEMMRWEKATGSGLVSGVAPMVPLMFEPGARWHYGYSLDWAGKLVEAISGMTLEQYFQQNIFKPLGMNDTTFILPAEKFDRLVTASDRQPDGVLKERTRAMPSPPAAFNGGGGLYSTAGDYVKFMQMILRKGRGPGGDVLLHPKTVAMMSTNQIGKLGAGRLKTQNPASSSDVDLHPGATDHWGLGFLINEAAYPGGRSAGSLAWAGLNNTFYWIDPKRDLCATIMMQFLPFVDKEAVGLLSDFERAVYSA